MIESAAKSMIFSWLGACTSDLDSKSKIMYKGFNLNGAAFHIGDCEADTLPYVGRIYRCWEDSSSNTGSSHNIEVKWFERRVNLDIESKGVRESEKEVMELEGTDVNPIGCISAKCLVVRAVSFEDAQSKMNLRVPSVLECFFSRGYFIQATNTFKPYTPPELALQQGLPPTLIPQASAHPPPTSLLSPNSLCLPATALASMTSAEVEAAVSGMFLPGSSGVDFDLMGAGGSQPGSQPLSALPPMFLPLNLKYEGGLSQQGGHLNSSLVGGGASPWGVNGTPGEGRGRAMWPPGFGIIEEGDEDQDPHPSSSMKGGSNAQRERPQPMSGVQQQQGSKRPATGRACVECGATQTPQWREGPAGPKTLCNACGVRHVRAQQKLQNGGGGKKPPRPGAGGGGGGGGGRSLGAGGLGGGGYPGGGVGVGLINGSYDLPHGGGGGGGGGNGSASHRSYDNGSSGESDEASRGIGNLFHVPGVMNPIPGSYVNPCMPRMHSGGTLSLFEASGSRQPPLGSSPLSSSTQVPVFGPYSAPTTLPVLPLTGLNEPRDVLPSPFPRAVAAATAASEEAARAAHHAALTSSSSPPQVSFAPTSTKPTSPQLETAKRLAEKTSSEAAAADAALIAVQGIFQAHSRVADERRREAEAAGRKLREFVQSISNPLSRSGGDATAALG